MRAHESRRANDIDSCPPFGREARHTNSGFRSAVGVCVEVRRQHCSNRTFGLRVRVGGDIDGQPRHVRAHRTAVFGFKNNRIEKRHSTPASRRIRFPSRPASFLVCTATQTSLPEVAMFQQHMPAFPRPNLDESRSLQLADHLGPGHLEILNLPLGFVNAVRADP